jgi:feruloyl esterase
VAAGAVQATRPVYPYPKVATYRGQGPTTDAASFGAADGKPWGGYPWAGTSLFAPGKRLDCQAAGGRLQCTLAKT